MLPYAPAFTQMRNDADRREPDGIEPFRFVVGHQQRCTVDDDRPADVTVPTQNRAP